MKRNRGRQRKLPPEDRASGPVSADRLDIGMETVRVHLRRVHENRHVHSRTEVAMKFRDPKDDARGPIW